MRWLLVNYWQKQSRFNWPWPEWVTPWLGRSLTFFLVIIAWVFFRANSFSEASTLLSAMFGAGGVPEPGTAHLLKTKLWIWLGALLAVVWFLPNPIQLLSQHKPALIIYKCHDAVSRWQWSCSWFWVGVTAILGYSRKIVARVG
jgi:alginate O-acetyltransferase complex protein AlgI